MGRILRFALTAYGLVAVFVLLGGCTQTSPAQQEAEDRQDTSARREAAEQEKIDTSETVKESPTPEKQSGEEKAKTQPGDVDRAAGADQARVLAENDLATTPSYYKLTDRTKAGSLEVPSSWEYVMGVDSEA